MASTLTSLSTRVNTYLMDTSNQVWDAATITEGMRLALGEYGLAGNAAVSLSGLDGAALTTLPANHDTVIVLGGAAYAALAQAADRADGARLGTAGAEFKTWGEARLREFKAMLGVIFPGYLAVLAAGSGTGSGSGADPAKTAAEVALLGAQTTLASAQAAAASGQEGRAAAAAAQAAADKAAEAARVSDLRTASNPAWGNWADKSGIDYPGGYERS